MEWSCSDSSHLNVPAGEHVSGSREPFENVGAVIQNKTTQRCLIQVVGT